MDDTITAVGLFFLLLGMMSMDSANLLYPLGFMVLGYILLMVGKTFSNF